MMVSVMCACWTGIFVGVGVIYGKERGGSYKGDKRGVEEGVAIKVLISNG